LVTLFFFFYQPHTIAFFAPRCPTTSHPQDQASNSSKQGVGLAFSRISQALHPLVAFFAD
jgi:hypothetical protein